MILEIYFLAGFYYFIRHSPKNTSDKVFSILVWILLWVLSFVIAAMILPIQTTNKDATVLVFQLLWFLFITLFSYFLKKIKIF